MEKPTETITNKIFNYFENNHQGKNWTLFLIILGLVHSAWWFGTFDFIKEFGTQNPYFIFLEILFIASSITRILIVIDIFYIINNNWLCDWIMKKLWKKRRDEWGRWRIVHLSRINDDKYVTALDKLCDTSTVFHVIYNIPMHSNKFTADHLNTVRKNFNTDSNHIQYWIKLEIKKRRKAIAKEQKAIAKEQKFRQRNAKRKLQKSKT